MSTDLENDLRAMLRGRATTDITDVPESVFAFERDAETAPTRTGPESRRPPWRRPQLLAVAAGVVTVLAVSGTVLAVRGDHSSAPTRPANTGPATNPVTTPPPTPAVGNKRVRRTAALSWFGLKPLPAYRLGERESFPGYRSQGLTLKGDTGVIAGSNGGAPWTVFAYVFDPGRFDPTTVRTWRKTAVGGQPARIGRMASVGDASGPARTTLAMQSPAGRWVVVQGRTVKSSTDAVLTTVAGAVLPDTSVPLPVPFRLAYVPTGSSVEDLYQDLSGTYATRVRLTGPLVRLEISIYRGNFSAGSAGDTPQHRQVGGLDSSVIAAKGLAVTKVGTGLTVYVQVTTTSNAVPLDRAQQSEFTKILAGIKWAANDTRGAEPSAEQAIP